MGLWDDKRVKYLLYKNKISYQEAGPVLIFLRPGAK